MVRKLLPSILIVSGVIFWSRCGDDSTEVKVSSNYTVCRGEPDGDEYRYGRIDIRQSCEGGYNGNSASCFVSQKDENGLISFAIGNVSDLTEECRVRTDSGLVHTFSVVEEGNVRVSNSESNGESNDLSCIEGSDSIEVDSCGEEPDIFLNINEPYHLSFDIRKSADASCLQNAEGYTFFIDLVGQNQGELDAVEQQCDNVRSGFFVDIPEDERLRQNYYAGTNHTYWCEKEFGSGRVKFRVRPTDSDPVSGRSEKDQISELCKHFRDGEVVTVPE